MAQSLRVNGERLWSSIMDTARFGGTTGGGVTRLTLSDADKEARDWFVAQCEAVGCSISVDEVGNIFARRAGRDSNRQPIAFGSHLDTQPSGGKFDGIAGVMSGLEVMRTLDENGVVTDAPLELINWTNEEGSRFAPTMIASGAFAGIYTAEFAHGVKDRQGNTFRGELQRIGYLGERKAVGHALAAYFELHIEQGPILDEEGVTIGVVTGAQGQRWYEVNVQGRDSHAGSTPMTVRRDAMLACARITDGVNAIALNHAPAGMATVGLVEVSPNSRNVIPGHVFFTVDLRHPDGAVLMKMHREYEQLVERVARSTRTGISSECVLDLKPTRFDRNCVDIVREVAERLQYSHRDIVSGPGHDAVNVATVAPTAMIFVPCVGGISHNEAEAARQDDLAAGANVLLQTVLERDQQTHAGG